MSTTFIAGREVLTGEPWFDDGNIILMTEGEPTAFRLHRGVLSRHSDIFRDMFEIGQPIHEDHDQQNACQVVTMYDNPADLSSLLHVLYDGVPTDPHGFFQLAGVLRLATKYFATRIRSQVIRLLAQMWSYTLDGHDQMLKSALEAPLINDTTYPYIHPLHILNLARETDAQVLLPSALYFLSVYPLAEILAADHPKLAVKHPSCPSSKLSLTDIQAYTLMYQYRIQTGLDFIHTTCKKWSTSSCANLATCGREFPRLLSSSRLLQAWNPKTGSLHFILQVTGRVSSDPLLCTDCRAQFKAEAQRLRATIWDSLPGVVNLPPWDEMISTDLS